MTRYEILVQILDELRKEAPTEYKTYYLIKQDQNHLFIYF